ncbi:hypothetical protein BP5796_05571 [Coleophoma crateriformis]|uniref:HORMA domain-containing protein n=1 Tax=Coleophoma crateriformis TaxID=565419 RepID=A0A3D8S3J0_9HELO|nr:hypothetical protein BP5796_05571 [Coleophoma crateriformis]
MSACRLRLADPQWSAWQVRWPPSTGELFAIGSARIACISAPEDPAPDLAVSGLAVQGVARGETRECRLGASSEELIVHRILYRNLRSATLWHLYIQTQQDRRATATGDSQLPVPSRCRCPSPEHQSAPTGREDSYHATNPATTQARPANDTDRPAPNLVQFPDRRNPHHSLRALHLPSRVLISFPILCPHPLASPSPHLQARTHDEIANRTFLLTRAYNFPVRQNRHPDVCKWILSTVSHIEALMKKGTVARIVVPIHHISTGEVMERYIFDVSTFPSIPANSLYVPFEDALLAAGPSAAEREQADEDGKLAQPQSLVDIEEQLRATIRKLAYAAEKLDPLPEEECTFTVAVELKDSKAAEPPIDHLGIWEASEPSLQPREKASATNNVEEGNHSKGRERGRDIGGVKSVAVRNVEAGEFRIESWIEEGRGKEKWMEENKHEGRRWDE